MEFILNNYPLARAEFTFRDVNKRRETTCISRHRCARCACDFSFCSNIMKHSRRLHFITFNDMKNKWNFANFSFLSIFDFLRADKPASHMSSLIREMLLLLLVYFRIDDGYSRASSWGLTQIIGCLPAVNNLHKGLAGRPSACVLDTFLVWVFVRACANAWCTTCRRPLIHNTPRSRSVCARACVRACFLFVCFTLTRRIPF